MKTFIQNRLGQKVCVVVTGENHKGKLAFVMHGLSGNKNEPHLRAMGEAFLDAGYVLVTFDTTNTFGESDGQYEDATLTGYFHDLEDVIAWATTRPWYSAPFVLCGHSLGGISVALYAQKYPERVKALAPISTVVSGELSLEVPKWHPRRLDIDQWRRDGVRITHEHGHELRLKWACMEDRLGYDLLPAAAKLTMPVLMVVGSADEHTPPEHQQILFDKLPGRKEMHIIDGATHVFARPSEQAQLRGFVENWLKTV